MLPRQLLRSSSRLAGGRLRLGNSFRTLTGFAPHLPPLPPYSEWPKLFPPQVTSSEVVVRELRPFMMNPNTIFDYIKALELDKEDGSPPKTIVEIYAGPGVLSRGLLSLPPSRLKKLIIMENGPPYQESLKALAAADDRVVLLPHTGYDWATYDLAKEQGAFDDIEVVTDRTKIHPTLRFVCQMPLSVAGEQLISQLIRCIPENQWLFHYGRVPLHFIITDWVRERLTAPRKTINRGKLSVLAEATSEITTPLPFKNLVPYDSHFYPASVAKAARLDSSLSFRRAGHPMHTLTLTPRENVLIPAEALDAWDFVLRAMFVLKNSPIKKALPTLAPGAGILQKKLAANPETAHIDCNQKVRDATAEDWAGILKEFVAWPFAPKELLQADASPIRVGKGIFVSQSERF